MNAIGSMRKVWVALLLAGTLLHAGEINIAVAANVSYAMDELKATFAKEHPDTRIRVTLGSSGKLTAQIRNGAPYGLFMAANMRYPEALHADGIAVTEPIAYAQGALAFFSVKPMDYAKGITLVSDTRVKKIAVANPKTAPYGKAAVEAMTKAGLLEEAQPKLVFAESISQTVAYTITAADIGFIAKSSLYSPKMAQYQEGINWVTVDPELYTPIQQGIVLLRRGEHDPEYRAFYDFILGEAAKTIFRRYGYLVQ